MTNTVLIFGATSAIAEATARIYAKKGQRLILVGRASEKLEVIANDLRARGAEAVQTLAAEASDYDNVRVALSTAWSHSDGVDIALIAHGTLPDQAECESNTSVGIDSFRVNAESVLFLLNEMAQRFEQQGNGTIAVIGSVAGDRGRASNYWYGTAKAAVDAFASGLRGRLFPRGVHIVTIKPGFVDTPMTRDLKLPGPLVAAPEKVALDIWTAIDKRRDVVYSPWFWRYIMLVIAHLPTRIFKRLKF